MSLALALALVTAVRGDEALAQEQAALEARVAAEAEVVDALLAQKETLAGALEALTAWATASQARARALERALGALDARADAVAAALRETAARRAEAVAQLGPQLEALRRLGRKTGVGALLAQGDVAAALRRQRALAALAGRQAQALEVAAELEDHQRLVEHRLKLVEASSRAVLAELTAEGAASRRRLARLRDAVKLVGALANTKGREVAELTASAQQLERLVDDERAREAAVGFRALKGQLPMPVADGLVEVGFGRVVNPRFNTVTVQKGLDIRAPAGDEVRAVAEGTVVYVGWLKGYGTLVIVDHGGDSHTLYAHLGAVAVAPGDAVEAEQALGAVGESGSLKGAYLYFEVRRGGQAVDPLPWLAPEE